MKRILYIAPNFYPSTAGYAHACTAFVLELLKRTQIAVDVVTFAPLGDALELQAERLSVTRMRIIRPFGLLNPLSHEIVLLWHIRRKMSAKNFDFILFEAAEYPLAGLATLSMAGVSKVLVRIHAVSETEWALFRQHYRYLIKRWPTKLFMRRVRNILSTCSFYIDFTKKYFLKDNPLLIASKHFHVIPNIVQVQENLIEDDVQLLPDDIKQLLRGNIVFLTLGRIDTVGELQKNFTRLFMALSLLKNRGYFSSLKLVVVGSGSQKERLKSMTQDLGIRENMLFYDFLDNKLIHEIQRRCHAVVLAATFEGMSMFAFESLANGAPLLCSRVGGIQDLVDDCSNGLLFDPMDPFDIAEKIDSFILKMMPHLADVRRSSREKFERQFPAERTIAKFMDVLELLRVL